MEQKPSIGRIVHYKSYGTPGGEYKSECRAGIITEVDEDSLNDPMDRQVIGVCILNPSGQFFNQGVIKGTEGGQWHWPERV